MSAYMSGKYFTDYTVLHVVYSYVYIIVAPDAKFLERAR